MEAHAGAPADLDYLRSLGPRPKAWLAVALAWVAGYVDIIGWIMLSHVYTSHMTGNTASLGHALAAGEGQKALAYGIPIPCFVLGLIAGAFILQIGKRRRIHSTLALVLGLEALLLGLFVLLGFLFEGPEGAVPQSDARSALLLFLAASAMGLQTVTLTRIGRLRVYTTYLTGTLSKFAESLAEYSLWVYDRGRGRFFRRIGRIARATPRQESFQHLVLTAGLWAGFACGVLCGTRALRAWNVAALGLPIALLLLFSLVDAVRPVSLAHERAGSLWLEEMLPSRKAQPFDPQKPSGASR
ncbi:MAG TPA: YoaK family protein [Chthonomonadaceae bacterium]|nr:YoaK family protein [Chthonomonadaceae bacterium]